MRKQSYAWVVLSLWIGFSPVVRAASFVDRALGLFAANSFSLEEDRFEGRWQDSEHWRGTFCNGYWGYQGKLWGRIQDLKFDLNDDESIGVVADLRSINGSVRGQYQSWQSACVPVAASAGVTVPWADIRGTVWILESEDEKLHVKLKITRTRLGKIETHSRLIPDWMEEMGTNLLNFGLERIWQSSLGDKISKKLSQYLEEHVPAESLPF